MKGKKKRKEILSHSITPENLQKKMEKLLLLKFWNNKNLFITCHHLAQEMRHYQRDKLPYWNLCLHFFYYRLDSKNTEKVLKYIKNRNSNLNFL